MTRLPAEKRRELLLDAAAVVFASYGYSGATTAQLAKAAGVTEPIIYRHFASKRDLFIALIQRTGAATIRLWETNLRGATDPADRLTRLLGANPMVTVRGSTLYRVVVQAMTEVEDPQIQRALHEHISQLHTFLRDEVASAQAAGVVSKRFSPEATAWSLIYLGLGYGVLTAMRAVEDDGSVQDLLGSLMLGERYRRG
ncbi:MAG: TetR/AcrR family transcriptional regulator [Phycisphaerae bacterium]|nr:TetR/AcrR family transcriptional regulator [Phycisphaerae bacterium]